MKWMTVQEYADYEEISLAAAYKRIKEGRAKSSRRFGKLVVQPKKQAA
jgi:hypothetical protein